MERLVFGGTFLFLLGETKPAKLFYLVGNWMAHIYVLGADSEACSVPKASPKDGDSVASVTST